MSHAIEVRRTAGAVRRFVRRIATERVEPGIDDRFGEFHVGLAGDAQFGPPARDAFDPSLTELRVRQLLFENESAQGHETITKTAQVAGRRLQRRAAEPFHHAMQAEHRGPQIAATKIVVQTQADLRKSGGKARRAVRKNAGEPKRTSKDRRMHGLLAALPQKRPPETRRRRKNALQAGHIARHLLERGDRDQQRSQTPCRRGNARHIIDR
ncbi:MAG: hypothetical protein ABI330_00090 [Caldimonas sp.]